MEKKMEDVTVRCRCCFRNLQNLASSVWINLVVNIVCRPQSFATFRTSSKIYSYLRYYHKSCVSKYNAQKLERAVKRSEKTLKRPSSSETIEESGPSKRTRSHDEKITFGESKCLFCITVDVEENMCAAGTMHATDEKTDKKHVVNFTEQLKIQALKLNKSHIIETLSSVGDVTAKEIWYHKLCYNTFINSYDSLLRKEAKEAQEKKDNEFHKAIFFRRVVVYVIEQRNMSDVFAFPVRELETMYEELLQSENIPYTSRSSRFRTQSSKR